MTDDILANPPERVRGRPFQKGRSGNPAGRRPGSRNKATIAAAQLLAGEAEGLTRRAVQLASRSARRCASAKISSRPKRIWRRCAPACGSSARSAPGPHSPRSRREKLCPGAERLTIVEVRVA